MSKTTKWLSFFGSSPSGKGSVSAVNKNPPNEIEAAKIDAFRTISEALYKGQSSFLKRKSSLLSQPQLTTEAIEEYVRLHPQGRSAKAWELAEKHYDNVGSTNEALFKAIHQYSFKMSSTFFGLFKRSTNFPNNNYENEDRSGINDKIRNADEDSRTGIIRETLDRLL